MNGYMIKRIEGLLKKECEHLKFLVDHHANESAIITSKINIDHYNTLLVRYRKAQNIKILMDKI